MHPSEFHTRNKRLHWNNYESTTTPLPSHGADPFSLRTERSLLPGSASREHLVLELPEPRLERNLNRHRCMFWREKLPMLRQRLIPSKCCKEGLTGSISLSKNFNSYFSDARCNLNPQREAKDPPSNTKPNKPPQTGNKRPDDTWKAGFLQQTTSFAVKPLLSLLLKILPTYILLSRSY